MIIRINDTPVDFTLEQERTFAELHQSVSAWAEAQNLELLSILADGKALPPDDGTALEGMAAIDIEAVPASSAAQARLGLVSRFFALVAQAGPEQLGELRAQYASVRPVVPVLMAPIAERLSDELSLLDSWAPGFEHAAARLAAAAASLYQELADPRAALAEALDRLEAVLPGEELSQLFQKGQDRDGFQRILSLFTAFEDLSRRAELVEPAPDSWTDFQDGLRPFLGEARDALDAGDHILLTDLLEYEIVPRLSAARACFSANLDPAARQP